MFSRTVNRIFWAVFILITLTGCSSDKDHAEKKYTDYVSVLTSIEYENIIDKENTGVEYTLFIGRESCPPCNLFVEMLYDVVQENNLDIYYWNIEGLSKESKGGRPRILQIKKEHVVVFKIFLENKKNDPEKKVLNYKTADSLNNFFYQKKKDIFKNPDEVKQKNFHALRKVAAQNYYNECRLSGSDIDESLGKVSEFLGHGYDRDRKLINIYVANVW